MEKTYNISNGFLSVDISNIGASIQSINLKGRELCLGFSQQKDRLDGDTYGGAVIGRVANRIADGKFTLNGTTYFLTKNEGDNTLHGGKFGFDRYTFEIDPNSAPDYISMAVCSPDGDQGFPGKLVMRVEYILEGLSLTVSFTAVSDKDTVWAPTLHPYFRLGGEDTIDDTYLQIYADFYTPMDARQIPTGAICSVDGTPFDFRTPKKIGADIGSPILNPTGGYDHNFVLRGNRAATAYNKGSGVKMDIYTDMPGLHFYSGNFLKGNNNGKALYPREGFALEPQFFPNAINTPAFKQPVLKANDRKTYYIKYVFEESDI